MNSITSGSLLSLAEWRKKYIWRVGRLGHALLFSQCRGRTCSTELEKRYFGYFDIPQPFEGGVVHSLRDVESGVEPRVVSTVESYNELPGVLDLLVEH